MSFTEDQQRAITTEIQNALKPLNEAIASVNTKQAQNAIILENALGKVKSDAEARIEEMRSIGERYDQQMKAQLAKMEESGKKHEEVIQTLWTEVKDTSFRHSVQVTELVDKLKAHDEANVVWKTDVEKFVVDAKKAQEDAYTEQRRSLDVWVNQQKATFTA